MKKAIIKLTTVFGLSCLLIACGGGGGGSGNGGNNAPPPVQPIQPAPPAPQQPDAAPNIPAPPKDQALDTGAEGGSNPQKSPENDEMKNSSPSAQEKWEGACEAKSFCTAKNENKNHVTVYKLEHVENADKHSGTPDKYTKQEEHIILQLGEKVGKESEYKFTLLGTEENEVGYYGYRHNVDNNLTHKNVELLYAINADFKNKTQPSQLRAYYRKEKGFIYAPISNNQLSNNSLVNYGDVDLIYDEGKVSGSIYQSNNGDPRHLNKEVIFKVENKNSDSPSIEPIVDNLLGTIKKGDKTNLNYVLADSKKGNGDHQYLFGSAKAETWIGVLAAEKSNEKPAEKPANK
ncbi:TPA: hypothetical protein QB266_001884 [Pasteurella multocida]|uniref:hypothetical protein n=1 Tax=Pasteurella multocida TaxID=747 RepID=UPI0032FD38A2|nr:hypothetical protein [Pasteurella multocida]HDR1015791.1 hypothetical protein [Pasteurella multocida]HDR1018005.1 hypothetical protein [Pasteurella multocida]HDR1210244.1 hypothetical protein [Pasteurella multocida]HDR1246703.1 hypothetical protein [Pasteurella multocida]